jgi:hypothetical protein
MGGGSGVAGPAGGTFGSAFATGASGDRPLLVSNFGHWLAAAASPPIDTPSTPAINFQRDNDMG